jgi:hypothetical protein
MVPMAIVHCCRLWLGERQLVAYSHVTYSYDSLSLYTTFNHLSCLQQLRPEHKLIHPSYTYYQ